MSYHPANLVYVRCDRCGEECFTDHDTYFNGIDEARDFVAEGNDGWALIGDRTVCWRCWYSDADGRPIEAEPIIGGASMLAEKRADALPTGGQT